MITLLTSLRLTGRKDDVSPFSADHIRGFKHLPVVPGDVPGFGLVGRADGGSDGLAVVAVEPIIEIKPEFLPKEKYNHFWQGNKQIMKGY